MKISIVSIVYYIDRVLAIVEIIDVKNDNIIRTMMYRSSGTNVDNGKGHWFPFAGIRGNGFFTRNPEINTMFSGHISKDLVFVKNGGLYRSEYILKTRDAHSKIDMRYEGYDLKKIPFDIKEVAKTIKKEYDTNNFLPTYIFQNLNSLTNSDIELINTWIFHGLHARTPEVKKFRFV